LPATWVFGAVAQAKKWINNIRQENLHHLFIRKHPPPVIPSKS
jgi:hypothetical protein